MALWLKGNFLFNFISDIKLCKSVSLLLFLIKRPEIIFFSETHGLVMKKVLKFWQIIFIQDYKVEWKLVNNLTVMCENDPITIQWEWIDGFIAIPIGNVKYWLQKSTSLTLMMHSKRFMWYCVTHFTALAEGKRSKQYLSKNIINQKSWCDCEMLSSPSSYLTESRAEGRDTVS